ncbi:MAG TPA: Rrf2 family transcriptional regulator [Firmicutes bacterium]|nr:Rrf2 family transcriptional regulator [Bacillota bacterium]
MFKVSTKLRYGLRFLADLAIYGKDGVISKGKDSVISTKEVALRQKVSNNYLRQLVMQLSKEKIIGSARGKHGGVYLLKKPDEISLYDLYVLFEGEVHVVDCADENFVCDLDISHCLTRDVWIRLNEHIVSFLKGTTLKDILEKA